MRALKRILLLASIAIAGAAVAGPGALERPSVAEISEARGLIERFAGSERGPYSRLRWWCADGSVHPPKPYPCGERGGGWQHAEYSGERQRLAALGFRVGTVIRSLGWDELWDERDNHDRLRELSVERYLVDSRGGWVLQRAQFYRGRVQIEDEEAFGRDHLVELLSRSEWLVQGTNWLLARQSVRSIPHRGGTADRTAEVRRLSKELGAGAPSFFPIRVRIHTSPGPADIVDTREWLESHRGGLSAENLTRATSLIAGLERLFGDSSRAERMDGYRLAFRGRPLGVQFDRILEGWRDEAPLEQVETLAEVMELCRSTCESSGKGNTNLLLTALSFEAEQLAREAAFELLADRSATRLELMRLADALVRAGHGSGLLSRGEAQALRDPLAPLLKQTRVDVDRFLEATRGLERAGAWSAASVRHAFAAPLARYTALEPSAAGFVDEVLRRSILLPLSQVAGRLARDAEALSGLGHSIFGQPADGLAGLNPGVAVGRLRVLTEAETIHLPDLSEEDIVVLPRTTPELTPVAGIMTVAEGNVLSHVQVLARNLGIPNATLPSGALTELKNHAGRRVLLAVSSDGGVVLEDWTALPESLRARLQADDRLPDEKVLAPSPDIERKRPLPLAQLSAELSGSVVGPKAANLGELARLRPESVAPAIALPFGTFAEHATAGGENSPRARLVQAFRDQRAGRLDARGLERELESIGERIAALSLSPKLSAELAELMAREFGPPGSYGVFIRSDTNVEDLPGFTGAGLNRTLPNVVGLEAQLRGVPEVWASPFLPRAIRWRARALKNPEEVYPSVLIMKSMPSEKSGVLVTKDLITRGDGLTVATGWGPGGAVDGEIAETLVLRSDGSDWLVSESKAPYRREIVPSGGVSWRPVSAGPVLTADEKRQLREFAVQARGALTERVARGGVLDVEFGFLEGRLLLFQARPLVERGAARADRIVDAIRPQGGSRATEVLLDAMLAQVPPPPEG